MKTRVVTAAVILILAAFLIGTTETGNLVLDELSELVLGPETPSSKIRIASWNIRDFGKTKASDQARMKIIAQAIDGFDIIAIQEISNLREQSDPGCPRNQDACPGHENCGLIREALETHLNQDLGNNYTFLFSPQVADERYLFIYDPGKVELLDSGLVMDPADSGHPCSTSPSGGGLMARQPFKATFRAGSFDFILLNVHTSPDRNIQELVGLDHFYRVTLEEGEPDVIILGDINADCNYLGPEDRVNLRDPEYIWPIGDEVDTTSTNSDCAYDRFVFKPPTREDFTGMVGVVRGIPREVSDHYLIWADFYTERDSE
jgi:endonuclease/exonuclease/phosphatase family metal-dependent hydrolase